MKKKKKKKEKKNIKMSGREKGHLSERAGVQKTQKLKNLAGQKRGSRVWGGEI